MDQTQDMRKKEDIMKEEITTKELVIQEELEELIDVTHLLTHQGICMHLYLLHKWLMLGIKEKYMNWIDCKDI